MTSSGGAPDSTNWMVAAVDWGLGCCPPMVAKSAFTYAVTLTPWRSPLRTMWKSRVRAALPLCRCNVPRAEPSSAGEGSRPKYSRYRPVTTETGLALTRRASAGTCSPVTLGAACNGPGCMASGEEWPPLTINGELSCESGFCVPWPESSILSSRRDPGTDGAFFASDAEDSLARLQGESS